MLRAVVLAALVAGGCPPSPAPPDSGPDAAPPPTPPIDAAPPVDACAAAEAKLLQLGCKDSRGRLLGGPNMHGVPWSQICRDNVANGVPMQQACIASKGSCAEVESCR